MPTEMAKRGNALIDMECLAMGTNRPLLHTLVLVLAELSFLEGTRKMPAAE